VGDPFDEAALERAFVRLERPVYNVVYRSLWSAEEAHDVVQEAFLRLWDMRARVRPDTVDPLVYRIALNLARNRRRWLRLRTFVGLGPADADPGAGADRQLIDAEQERALRAAIDALPASQREVVLLIQFSGLSYREVGEALGIPEGTVGSRRTHALRALKHALGEPA